MTELPRGCALARDDVKVLRRVRDESEADDEAIKITLFHAGDGSPRGWFIAPLFQHGRRLRMPYLPKSAQALASVAIIRAIRLAEEMRCPLCLIDPEDLWESAWRS